MGSGAPYVLGPLSPPPHGPLDLLRFGTTKGHTAWAWGPPPYWDHREPRCMGAAASSVLGPAGLHHMGTGASSVLGPPRPPPHGRGGLLHV